MELLIKKKAELNILENSQPIYIWKNEKVCSGENTKGVAEFDKEISLIRLNQQFQSKLWAVYQYNREIRQLSKQMP